MTVASASVEKVLGNSRNYERNTKLTNLEGYELTRYYVTYFYHKDKFHDLKTMFECEDLVSTLYIKFVDKKLFEKYNPQITSKQYHIMNSVKNSMLDLAKRKYSKDISMETPIGDDLTLADTFVSEEPEYDEENADTSIRDMLISCLPDTTASKLVGYYPDKRYGFIQETNISPRAIALLLEAGHKPQEIATYFENPKTHQPITAGRVHKVIQEIREILRPALNYED